MDIKATNVDLNWFDPSEFREPEIVSVEFMVRLDALRGVLGKSITFSPVKGAIIRRAGKTKTLHNPEYWGCGLAGDVFIRTDSIHPRDIVDQALKVGFRGVGFYPHWKPMPGFHFDCRPGRIARWGAVKKNGKQVYVSLSKAFEVFG